MIPINISVTGHRDLSEDCIDRCREGICSIISDIKAKYSDSPINLLTGMAEGADMLAANAALELGCSITAVLAYKQEEFLRTFNNPENSENFYLLLEKADAVINIPVCHPHTRTEKRFSLLGEYLVQHSQLLIAVWDGAQSSRPGGTGDVVRMALEGVPHKESRSRLIMEAEDKIPVFYVKAKRDKTHREAEESQSADEGEDALYSVLYPDGFESGEKASRHYFGQLESINVYNRDSKKANAQKVDKAAEDLMGSEMIEKYPEINTLANEYATADTLAIKFQKKTIGWLKTLLMCGFLVFFWVTLFDEILPQYVNLLLLVPVFFGLCFLIYKYAQKSKIEMKYYEYRVLAESLRVQAFLKLGGVDEEVFEYYARKYESALGWILCALKNVSVQSVNTLAGKADKDRLALVYGRWIRAQQNYYTKQYYKTMKFLKKQKRLVIILFSLSMVFVALMYILQAIYGSPDIFSASGLSISDKSICLFMIDTLLAGGAIITGYIEKRQYNSQNAQYIRMIRIYNCGTEKYMQAVNNRDYKTAENLIKEIGIEALSENADWLLYNISSTMDLPIGK